MIVSLKKFCQEIDNKFSELANSVEKIFDYVRSINKNVHNQKTQYKIIFDPGHGEIEHYKFDACTPYSADNYLDDFCCGAELNVGDNLVAHNDYYEPVYLVVEKKIYSINRNTVFLVCHKVCADFVDYVYTSDFEHHVQLWSIQNAVIEKTKKEVGETKCIDIESEDDEKRYYYRTMAQIIWKDYVNEQHMTSIDFFNVQVRIQEILSQFHHYEYHRPTRYEFADD